MAHPEVMGAADDGAEDDPEVEPLIKDADPEFAPLLAEEAGGDEGDDGLAGVPAIRR